MQLSRRPLVLALLLVLLLGPASRPASAGRHHHQQGQGVPITGGAAPGAAATAGNWPQEPGDDGAGSQLLWAPGDDAAAGPEATEAAVHLRPHVGRLMLEATLADNASSSSSSGNNTGLVSGANDTTGSSAVAPTGAGAAAAAAAGGGSGPPAPTAQLTAVEVYQKRLHSRVLLLISDAWWLVYTIGLFAKALLGLFVPLVQVGRTGQVTIDATSVLNAGQLLAEFVARLGDLLSKMFLIASHAVAPI